MLKKNKQLLSVILTLCMVVSMFLGGTITTNAAETETLNSVTVTGLTDTISKGALIAETKATFDAPEGCITDSHWHMWIATDEDGSGEWFEVHDGAFTELDSYYLCMTFRAEDGYEFAEDFEVILPEGFEGVVWSEEDEKGNITYHCDMPAVSLGTAIYEIIVTTPEVVPGNTAALEDIVFYSGDEVIDNENFNIEAEWICETRNYEDVTGETFEDGCYYSFALCISPKEGTGYYFFNNLNVVHNGVADEFAFDVEPTHYDYYYSHSLLPAIEKVELSGLPAVKAGETMVDSLEAISDLEDLNCEIYVQWWDENEDETTGQEMEAGHVYTVQIEVNAFGQAPLSEDFVFVIDGTEYKVTEIDEYNEQPSQAWLEIEYDLSETQNNGGDSSNTDNSDSDNADKDSDGAKIGDSSMILLWVVLAVVVIGIVVFVRRKKA